EHSLPRDLELLRVAPAGLRLRVLAGVGGGLARAVHVRVVRHARLLPTFTPSTAVAVRLPREGERLLTPQYVEATPRSSVERLSPHGDRRSGTSRAASFSGRADGLSFER